MFEYEFMRYAFVAVLLLTPLLGLIGTMVVNNKMAFFSDAIGHSALTGIAIGVMIGFGTPVVALILFSILLAVIITVLKRKQISNTDTIISVVASVSTALGIVILSAGSSFNKYTQYIIGDILNVSKSDILFLAITLLVTILLWYFVYNRLLLTSLNRTIARSRGVPVFLYELLFSCLVAVVVAISIQWVGLLVINALIVIPSATSKLLAKNVKQYTLFSVVFSLCSGLGGLVLSYYIDTAAGATIVLINGILYFVASVYSALRK